MRADIALIRPPTQPSEERAEGLPVLRSRTVRDGQRVYAAFRASAVIDGGYLDARRQPRERP